MPPFKDISPIVPKTYRARLDAPARARPRNLSEGLLTALRLTASEKVPSIAMYNDAAHASIGGKRVSIQICGLSVARGVSGSYAPGAGGTRGRAQVNQPLEAYRPPAAKPVAEATVLSAQRRSHHTSPIGRQSRSIVKYFTCNVSNCCDIFQPNCRAVLGCLRGAEARRGGPHLNSKA